MLKILLSTPAEALADYSHWLPLRCREIGLTADVAPDHAPATVDYVVYAPNEALQDFTPFTRLKAVFSLWAGVEKIVGNDTIRVPLTRMVDPALTQGMVEYVCGHVLRYHLGMDRQINAAAHWDQSAPPLASARKVTLLGMGALGEACGQMLRRLGFAVHGWSRSAKTVDGITTHHGEAGLVAALEGAQIVVTLLPDTPQTHNIITDRTLAALAKGACLINPGRGTLIDEAALLKALDSGQLSHATLDTFRREPLPVDHPFWAHPRLTVTPHVAALTRPSSAAQVVAQNIQRAETGAPLLHLVDRARGY